MNFGNVLESYKKEENTIMNKLPVHSHRDHQQERKQRIVNNISNNIDTLDE
jgi:hypothetical protein